MSSKIVYNALTHRGVTAVISEAWYGSYIATWRLLRLMPFVSFQISPRMAGGFQMQGAFGRSGLLDAWGLSFLTGLNSTPFVMTFVDFDNALLGIYCGRRSIFGCHIPVGVARELVCAPYATIRPILLVLN